jgi:6-pyruvoyltetrahydropterin/6-carboxytetrahydropterin synthase
MGKLDLDTIIFSEAIKDDWSDRDLWEKIKKGESFKNPHSI